MGRARPARIDTIGPWSEIKLEIIRQYAVAYSTILSARKLYHVYIDAFAGAGLHISKAQKTLVPGSPLNAMLVQPPFCELHLIDLDGARVAALQEYAAAGPAQAYGPVLGEPDVARGGLRPANPDGPVR
ncbi:MAG: three-Cys-motif partner protein TcmP [Candidatus Latescibacterota bacterium]